MSHTTNQAIDQMNDHNTSTKIFEMFLYDQHCFTRFTANMCSDTLSDHCRDFTKENYLYLAFAWSESLEGFDYWNLIDLHWKKFLT